ncbi:MAG: glycosyltransferase [Anaerolineae bacterium]|nr:glycosyltransferase [Anaerolineae bacterium]
MERKIRRLHQFIIGATPGDAITDHAFVIQRWLREDGFASEIYAESIHPLLHGKVKFYHDYRPSFPGELVILHHSIGSDLVDYLLQQDLQFLVIYHNITPPLFFQSVDPVLVTQMQRGRRQLEYLRERTVLALGVSSFNEAELREAGFAHTGILPLLLDPSQYDVEPNLELMRRYQDEGPRLLFVGRLVPNKKQEDLIKLLYFYRRIEPSARLFLVGVPWVPAYAEWLKELAEELGLDQAVVFTGHVSQQDLVTYYRLADVYVSMSEHEGFGKPLIEAMYMGVPVLAYAASAVPETMGGAGILFHAKEYEALAELVDLILKDGDLKARIIARQRKRAEEFLEPAVRRKWEGFLKCALRQ